MRTKTGTIDELGRLGLFRDCTRRELEKLDTLGTLVHVAPGRILCVEDTVGREFLVICDGAVVLLRRGRELGRLGAGTGFGATSLLGGRTHPVTAVTTVPTDLLAFTRAEFADVLRVAPGVARRVSRRATALTRAATAFERVDGRPMIVDTGSAA